jgi:hypothetical protein
MQWRTFALPPRLPFSVPTPHSDCRGGGSEALCTAMRRRHFGTRVISVSYQARSLLDPPILRPETRGPGSVCLVSEPVCVCYLLCHVVQLSDKPFLYCFKTVVQYGWMEHAVCRCYWRCRHRQRSFRPSAVAAAPSASSSTFTPIVSAASSESGSASIRLCFNEQAFQYEWHAECIHNLCSARRLNLPATRGCRGHMRVQHGRLGEERYFLVVGMTRRREDVGGATLRERNDFFEFWRREGGRRS